MIRRRTITPNRDARAWCSGRWGYRRVRTGQCWRILTAEGLYTSLLADDSVRVRPGARGESRYTLSNRVVTIRWEIRPNAVWRRGRVFFHCPACARRCTRVYIPLEGARPECRVCWGLTYESRALRNYKDSIWGRGRFARAMNTTQREWALERTFECRTERRRRARLRWAERRKRLSAQLE